MNPATPTSADLLQLVNALATAVGVRIMSAEHAKSVFLNALDRSGYNTDKPMVKKKLPASSQPAPVVASVEIGVSK